MVGALIIGATVCLSTSFRLAPTTAKLIPRHIGITSLCIDRLSHLRLPFLDFLAQLFVQLGPAPSVRLRSLTLKYGLYPFTNLFNNNCAHSFLTLILTSYVYGLCYFYPTHNITNIDIRAINMNDEDITINKTPTSFTTLLAFWDERIININAVGLNLSHSHHLIVIIPIQWSINSTPKPRQKVMKDSCQSK